MSLSEGRPATLELRSEDDLAAAIARSEAAGGPVERRDDGAFVVDPTGNRLVLTRAAIMATA